MDTAFLMQQMQWREAAEEAQGEARDKLIAEVDAARTKEIGVLAAALDDARDNDAAVQSVRRLMFIEKMRAELAGSDVRKEF